MPDDLDPAARQPAPTVSADEVFRARVDLNRRSEDDYLAPDGALTFLTALGIEVIP